MGQASKVKFTEPRVESFTCEPGKNQSLFWDADTKGLCVRATAAGAKSYVFESRLNGRTVRLTVGGVESWPLQKARTEARRLQTLIDQGTDPRQERADKAAEQEAKRQEAKRECLTVGEAWEAYIKARKSKWSDLHLRDHLRLSQPGGEPKKRGKGLTEPGPLHSLMALKLSALSDDRIKEWLRVESAQRPTRVALAFRQLVAFCNWAEEERDYKGMIPAGAVTAKSVRDDVPKVDSKAGDCMQREQLPLWFGAVRQLSNPVQSAYLQSLLLTGARRTELLDLRWADVDFRWQVMTIRDKVEGERVIPLTPYVSHLLESLPRRNEWVFSSDKAAGGKLTDPNPTHSRIIKAAGLPHLTLHGLRRSFGTLAEWVEMPTGVVAQIQGHKPSAIAEKHYRRRPVDLLRMWHGKLEAWILEQAGVVFVPAEAQERLRVVA